MKTAQKTTIARTYPWGLNVRRGTRLLCGDGKIRAPKYLAQTADTFFSIPAAVVVGGRYITGYATCDEGTSTDCQHTRRAYTFRPHTESNAKAGNPLPPFPGQFDGMYDFLAGVGEDMPNT